MDMKKRKISLSFRVNEDDYNLFSKRAIEADCSIAHYGKETIKNELKTKKVLNKLKQ